MTKGKWLVSAFLLLSIAACSSIECPLDNRVYTTYLLAGDITTLTDTLTVSTKRLDNGIDTVLLNQAVNVDSFELPMSYNSPEVILYFTRSFREPAATETSPGTSGSDYIVRLTDTVVIAKNDIPHFEAVDCNPAFFHEITDIRYTRHGIDSIAINNSNVTHDSSKKHFHIYFKSRD